jgi:transcriptional regulator with XRE-family HTH domain
VITAKQIRASRALLGWSQQDLADAVGLSKPTIVDAERDGHQPRAETLALIQNACEVSGLEFMTGGVRERQDIVTVFEGEDCALRFLEEAFHSLKNTDNELLLYGSSDERATEEAIKKFIAFHDAGIKTRFLIKNNDTHIKGAIEDYRWMPDKLWIESDAKTIHGDTVTYAVTWQNKPKFICIKDKRIAEIEKKFFDFVWEISAKPTHTTVEQRWGKVA